MINFGRTSHRVALAALLAATTIGAAHAITESAFVYSTPKTGYYSIDAAALTPENDDAKYHQNIDFISPTDLDARVCFFTGVNLPHGATATQFTVWFSSGSLAPGGEPEFAFRRKKFSDGTNNPIAVRVVNDDTATRRAANVPVDADFAVINNAQYSYQVMICLQGSLDLFFNARLTYTYKNAGD